MDSSHIDLATWMANNWLAVAAILYAAASEIIGISPLKSNSVIQFIMWILGKMCQGGNAMKKVCLLLVMSLMTLALLGLPAQAQTTAPTDVVVPAPTTAAPATVQLGPFSLGMDNAILMEPGRKSFVAIGAGADIASGYDGILVLHGSALFPVGGNSQSGVIASLGVEVDLIKALSSVKQVSILVPNIQAMLGAAGGYDTLSSKPCFGPIFNLKWVF